ncbi:MAG TPA: DUF2304 family protein [Candidatus Saccharimonadales bacterium]|nr:DUF2304 family protein [Candidatus Saccharimonadales bacterium]
MLLTIIKFLALALTLLVIIKSYLAYRQRQETFVMFLFWSVTWLAVIIIAFYPEVITAVLGQRRLGVGSFLGIALVFVYFVLYRVYVKADRIEKRMHEIVRQFALKDPALSKQGRVKSQLRRRTKKVK